MAGAGAIEDTAGEKQKLGVLRHFVCLQINFYVGFSATAMKNRAIIYYFTQQNKSATAVIVVVVTNILI